jgi:hypothetical protein
MLRSSDGTRPNVAWWAALLLFVLGSVFIGLFIAARLLLSLESEQGVDAFSYARHSHLAAARAAQPAACEARSSSTASNAAALSNVS